MLCKKCEKGNLTNGDYLCPSCNSPQPYDAIRFVHYDNKGCIKDIKEFGDIYTKSGNFTSTMLSLMKDVVEDTTKGCRVLIEPIRWEA